MNSEACNGIEQKFPRNSQLATENWTIKKWWKVEGFTFSFIPFESSAWFAQYYIFRYFILFLRSNSLFSLRNNCPKINFSIRMKLKLLTSDILPSSYYFTCFLLQPSYSEMEEGFTLNGWRSECSMDIFLRTFFSFSCFAKVLLSASLWKII